MSERIRANKYMFFPDLIADLLKNLRQHVTVTRCVYEPRGVEGAPAIEFDVRLTKAGDLKYPAVSRPMTKKQFTARMVRLNARRFATMKGKQR